MGYELKTNNCQNIGEVSDTLLDSREEYQLYLSNPKDNSTSRKTALMLLNSVIYHGANHLTLLGKYLKLQDSYLSTLTSPDITDTLTQEQFLASFSDTKFGRKDLIDILNSDGIKAERHQHFPKFGEGSLAFEQK